VLDGLRGLAILLVVYHNCGYEQTQAFSPLLKVIYFSHAIGWVGVSLFFALSGFLITNILVESRGPGALRTFWIRRALRIFPLYYSFLFVLTIALPLVVSMPDPLSHVEYRGWYWAYLCNWRVHGVIPGLQHSWSLAVEEQFYLLWPLFVLNASDRTVLRTCVALAALALAARVGLRAIHAPPGAVYMFTFARMDGLTLGAAAALLLRHARTAGSTLRKVRPVLVGSVLVLMAMWPLTHGFNSEHLWVQTLGYGVLSILFAALVLDCVQDSGTRLARALSARWLRWLGKYSYAIYLFHLPIARVLGPSFHAAINAPPTLSAAGSLLEFELVVMGLSVGAAIGSWNLLERPFLELKERLAPSVPMAFVPQVDPEPTIST
jgi:peptidoglycan/LPS O-acetylase OafA/YrhL